MSQQMFVGRLASMRMATAGCCKPHARLFGSTWRTSRRRTTRSRLWHWRGGCEHGRGLDARESAYRERRQ